MLLRLGWVRYQINMHLTNCKLNYVYTCIALAVFTRSPAAYDALKSFKLLQLPSRRTLKQYIDANLEEAGECEEHLEEERKRYLEMIEERKR